jgi:hypothetical protein
MNWDKSHGGWVGFLHSPITAWMSPHSVALLSHYMRLIFCVLYWTQLYVSYLMYFVLPKSVLIWLKLHALMVFGVILYFYYWYFVCSCAQVGVLHWQWILMFVVVYQSQLNMNFQGSTVINLQWSFITWWWWHKCTTQLTKHHISSVLIPLPPVKMWLPTIRWDLRYISGIHWNSPVKIWILFHLWHES